MGDGAHLGTTAGRAIDTILGGADQPTEEEQQTPEQVRARIEAAPLFIGERPYKRRERDPDFDSYSAATDSLAHAFLILLDEHPELADPVGRPTYPDDYLVESLRGEPLSLDRVLWDRMKERWPHADEWMGGASGFMAGFAANIVLHLHGMAPEPNPAIVTVEVP